MVETPATYTGQMNLHSFYTRFIDIAWLKTYGYSQCYRNSNNYERIEILFNRNIVDVDLLGTINQLAKLHGFKTCTMLLDYGMEMEITNKFKGY